MDLRAEKRGGQGLRVRQPLHVYNLITTNYPSSFFTANLFLLLLNLFSAEWDRLSVSLRISSLQDGKILFGSQ